MPSQINKNCTYCTLCVSVCPTHSIFPGIHTYVIDSDTCEECKVCIPTCPAEAITCTNTKAVAPAATKASEK